MLTLANIRDWIKTLNTGAEHFYIGKLENKKEKSIGVYDLKENTPFLIPLGGLQNKSYGTKKVSILIHWNNDANETEIASQKLFKKLQNIRNIEIAERKVLFALLLVPEAQDVGTDESKIYERVIEIEFYYERKEN